MSLPKRVIPPKTVLRLSLLWPHARKQGREIGQIYRVGYYCRHCGPAVIWLVDSKGDYVWSVDLSFLKKHFEVLETSKENSVYGSNRPKLGKLNKK